MNDSAHTEKPNSQHLIDNAWLNGWEITDHLFDTVTGQQAVNQAARALAAAGKLVRRPRSDGTLGNYLAEGQITPAETPVVTEGVVEGLSEDEVKHSLKRWLEASGWQVSMIWGRGRGIDVEAKKDDQRWVIEVKGCGSLAAMRVNYFLSILGEVLQRMNDPKSRYSIALPDIKQFRGLWARLPQLAKSRTQISALFVNESGQVEEA